MDAARTSRRVARAWFLRRLRWTASQVDAEVEVDVALDARIGRRTVFEITPGSRSRVEIGAGTRLWDDVTFALRGGEIVLGPWCDVRRGVVLNVAGSLRLAGSNILSWGTVVHCAGRIDVEEFTIVGEYSSLVDSTHYHTEPDVPVHRNVKPGTITIGRNVWVGAKATILRDSHVGDYAIVAAGAIVRGEVPAGHLAAGGGSDIRPRRLPWDDVRA